MPPFGPHPPAPLSLYPACSVSDAETEQAGGTRGENGKRQRQPADDWATHAQQRDTGCVAAYRRSPAPAHRPYPTLTPQAFRSLWFASASMAYVTSSLPPTKRTGAEVGFKPAELEVSITSVLPEPLPAAKWN